DLYRIDTLLVELVPIGYAFGVFLLAIFQFARSGKMGLVTLMGVCSLGLFAGLFAWIHNYQRETDLNGLHASNPLVPFAARSKTIVCRLLDVDAADEPRLRWWWIAVPTAYCWSITWIAIGISNPLLLAKGIGTLG